MSTHRRDDNKRRIPAKAQERTKTTDTNKRKKQKKKNTQSTSKEQRHEEGERWEVVSRVTWERREAHHFVGHNDDVGIGSWHGMLQHLVQFPQAGERVLVVDTVHKQESLPVLDPVREQGNQFILTSSIQNV